MKSLSERDEICDDFFRFINKNKWRDKRLCLSRLF